MGSTILAMAAMEYMNAGLTVMPLEGKAPAKIENVTGWPQVAGRVETPEDVALVDSLFMRADTTGVAIIIPTGLCVVDIDGEEGAAALFHMLGNTDISGTAVASTGRGLHIWFATAGEQRTTKLAEKLDLKGVGGYVAAPPSIHPSGRQYTWLDPLIVDGRIGVNFLPEPVEKLLATRALLASTTVRHGPYMEMVFADGKFSMVEKPSSMLGLVAAMEGAKDGERNNMLNWAAFRAREDGVPLNEAFAVLGPAAEGVGLSLQEIKQTIRSAYRTRG